MIDVTSATVVPFVRNACSLWPVATWPQAHGTPIQGIDKTLERNLTLEEFSLPEGAITRLRRQEDSEDARSLV